MVFYYDYKKIDRDLTYKGEIDLCIVYSIWNNPVLIDMVTYSILSFYNTTDIHKCSIRIFVCEDIIHLVEEKFGPLNLMKYVVKVPVNLEFKHIVVLHPELESFETVCILDSDLFSYFIHSDKYRLFEYLKDISKSQPVVFDKTLTENEYYIRKNTLQDLDERYEKVLSYPKDTFWSWSSLFCYNTKLLNTEEYYKLVLSISFYKNRCDESVFMTYFDKKDITTISLNILPYVLPINKHNLNFYKNNIFIEESNYLKLLHIVEPTEEELVRRILSRVFNQIETNETNL